MPDSQVTALLIRAKQGDQAALGEVYKLLHAELAQIARARLRRSAQQTMNTMVLINESYVKLVDQNGIDVGGRAHFLALASRAMRHILIDYFRRHAADKRGGPAPLVTLNEELTGAEQRGESLLALDAALEKLAAFKPRLAQVVECRFFGGMTYEEIGEALHIAERTARLDWRKAKLWLALELGEEGNTGG